jgi:hypothetical protein
MLSLRPMDVAELAERMAEVISDGVALGVFVAAGYPRWRIPI